MLPMLSLQGEEGATVLFCLFEPLLCFKSFSIDPVGGSLPLAGFFFCSLSRDLCGSMNVTIG